MSFRILMLSLVLAVSTDARLGETAIQFADRYGVPKDSKVTRMSDTSHPILAGALHHTYEYQGWTIRAAFLQLDGPAVRMEFQKRPAASVSSTIEDYELQAIASANLAPGMAWQQTIYTNANSPHKGLAKIPEAFFADAIGARMWQRSDGAILALKAMRMSVGLELPAARAHEEQLKAAREQKARASVPRF